MEKENPRDRCLAGNHSGKRDVAVLEYDGRSLPVVFKSESAALSHIAPRVATNMTLIAGETGSWNDLHGRFKVSQIDHDKVYSTQASVYTNGAEEFLSRMRWADIGHHHHIAGPYLVRYAQERAWREDHRRIATGAQVKLVAGLAMAAPTSVDWCGYWQRGHRAS